jgi:NADH dehydrogenase FAD-containing subunit
VWPSIPATHLITPYLCLHETGAKLFDVLEVGPMGGWGTYLFWRSFYLSEMFTLRTKLLLASDWFRTHVFGRDISRY